MVNIRLAKASDACKLAELVWVFVGDEFCSSAEYIQNYLQNHRDIILVAEHENMLVGYCAGRISRHMSFKDPIADVVELFLAEEYRGKGIGKKLLAKMEAELLKHGANRIRILVREGNEHARKFYSACGYEEYNMVMCRKNCVVTR